jgi:hypothetical protein
MSTKSIKIKVLAATFGLCVLTALQSAQGAVADISAYVDYSHSSTIGQGPRIDAFENRVYGSSDLRGRSRNINNYSQFAQTDSFAK